jgi:hypothetical protein
MGNDVRHSVGRFTRRIVEHQRKSGVAIPDSRAAERKAQEVARRNDRRQSENRK